MLLVHPVAAAAAQPAGADSPVIQFLEGDSSSATCGDFSVSWTIVRSTSFRQPGSADLHVTNTSDGQPVFDLTHPLAPGEALIPLWCGDLLGDGSQVLGFEEYTGGIHCCYAASVILLNDAARHLLDVDLGQGGLFDPQQLGSGGGPLQLPASSDVFAYFDDLSFSVSPFLPLVYAYDGARYVEATRTYPNLIRADIDQAEDDLTVALASRVEARQESAALDLYGLHVLLGDADAALPLLKSRLSPAVATWLGANASPARSAMASRYHLT